MPVQNPDHMDNDVNQNDKKVHLDEFALPPIPKIVIGKASNVRRKFSLSASLHANLLGVTPLKNDEVPPNFNTKRRFSNVGDVVSRKLSTTIGWRTAPSVPPDEVIAQGRVLCGQYIRNRLKRSGIFSKKLGLYRLRSMVGTSSAIVVREVFPSLICAGTEIERLHPKLYTNVARQASPSTGSVLVSDKAAAALLSAIGQDLFKSDITWGKVVSIFAVAGGLAVDCVCQGHPEYLHGLLEGMVEILEDSLADWIGMNGGWTGLSNQCRTPDEEMSPVGYALIFIMAVIGLLVAYLIIFFLWEFLFPTKKSIHRLKNIIEIVTKKT